MVNILVIAVFVIPWLILPFNNIPDCTRLIKDAFFDMTMFGMIVMALKNGLKFEYKNKYLAWLSAWVFFTCIFNWYYPIVRGFGYNAGTIDSMVHSILAIIVTMLICSNFERVDFIRCAKAICISTTLVAVFCIFQGIGLDPMKHIASYGFKESRHVAALLDNPDIAGNYLCMVFPLFLYLGKPKYYICMALCGIALLFTQSSISIVAAFVGLFVYLIFRFSKLKKVVLILLATQLLFVVFCFMTPSFNKVSNGFTGRVGAWKMLIERTNNPLFGQGLGIVKSLNVATGVIPESQKVIMRAKGVSEYDINGAENHWTYAHNDYLEMYCSLGALGLFLFVLLVINTLKNFNYREDNQVGFAYYGCFVSFLLVMFGSFPMEMPPIALNGLIFFWALSKT